MIGTTRFKTARFTKEELKAAGIDPTARICPYHPNVVSINGARDIILQPYKNTKFDKKLGRDIIVGMGLGCPRCLHIFPTDLTQAHSKVDMLPDAGKTQEKGAPLPYPTDMSVGEGHSVPNLGNRGEEPVG
jgi:hypothetical protein